MMFQGTVAEQPELSFTPAGKAVCNMYVETENERLTVVTWNELAEKVSQHIQPEDRVEIYGEKKMRWWTEEGEKVSREEVNARRVKVIARPIRPEYCCLSCVHWQADCLGECYSAFGGPAEREGCIVEDGVCMTKNSDGVLMNRDCWEKR